jgi:DNA polymerase (family 10)
MLLGGNPYRAKAYLRAAERIALLSEPIKDLVAQNRLRDIPGVGEAIAQFITQVYKTGSHPALERMRAEIPESVLEMLTIPGLRPDKVLKLHSELGIDNLEDLEAACKQDRLKNVKGFGPSLQRKIVAGLETRNTFQRAKHLHRAADLLETAKASLVRSGLGLRRIEIAGDFRRGCELVSALSMVGEQAAPEATRVNFGELTLHLTTKRRFGCAWLFATGSDAHLKQLQNLALKKGMSLEPDGLYRDGKLVASRTEEEIYEALGLAFIDPELREGRGETRSRVSTSCR